MTRGAEVLNIMWEKLKAEGNEVVNEENFFWLNKAIEALERKEELLDTVDRIEEIINEYRKA